MKTMKWRLNGLIISKGQKPQQWWGTSLFVVPCRITQMGGGAPKMQNIKKNPNIFNLKNL
jgi:hypothetical protein